MNKCPNCGNEVLEDDTYCNNCGYKLPKKKDNKTQKNDLKIIALILLIFFVGSFVAMVIINSLDQNNYKNSEIYGIDEYFYQNAKIKDALNELKSRNVDASKIIIKYDNISDNYEDYMKIYNTDVERNKKDYKITFTVNNGFKENKNVDFDIKIIKQDWGNEIEIISDNNDWLENIYEYYMDSSNTWFGTNVIDYGIGEYYYDGYNRSFPIQYGYDDIEPGYWILVIRSHGYDEQILLLNKK